MSTFDLFTFFCTDLIQSEANWTPDWLMSTLAGRVKRVSRTRERRSREGPALHERTLLSSLL